MKTVPTLMRDPSIQDFLIMTVTKITLPLKRCNRHHYIWIQMNSHLTYKVTLEQRQQNYLHHEIIIQEKTTLQVQMMKTVYFCLQ